MADTELTRELAPPPQEPVLPRKYSIDFDAYAAKNRSRDTFLRDRMCAESRAQPGSHVSTRAQAPAGRVRFNTRRGHPAADDPITTIQECCSKKPEYREPRLPVKEVLFRVLLAAGNRPMAVEDLRAAAAQWTGYEYGGGITAEAIEQLLACDEYYGFQAAEEW